MRAGRERLVELAAGVVDHRLPDQRLRLDLEVPRLFAAGERLLVEVERPVELAELPVGIGQVGEAARVVPRVAEGAPQGQRLLEELDRPARLAQVLIGDAQVVQGVGLAQPVPRFPPEGKRAQVAVDRLARLPHLPVEPSQAVQAGRLSHQVPERLPDDERLCQSLQRLLPGLRGPQVRRLQGPPERHLRRDPPLVSGDRRPPLLQGPQVAPRRRARVDPADDQPIDAPGRRQHGQDLRRSRAARPVHLGDPLPRRTEEAPGDVDLARLEGEEEVIPPLQDDAVGVRLSRGEVSLDRLAELERRLAGRCGGDRGRERRRTGRGAGREAGERRGEEERGERRQGRGERPGAPVAEREYGHLSTALVGLLVAKASILPRTAAGVPPPGRWMPQPV